MEIVTIHKRMIEVENYKKENKVAREAMKSELENNSTYLEICEEVKVATEKRNRLKTEILAKPEVEKLVFDIHENKEEIDTLEEILSAELMEYCKDGKKEIEDPDGEKREIKLFAKIMPRKNKWNDRDNEGKYAPAEKVEPKLNSA